MFVVRGVSGWVSVSGGVGGGLAPTRLTQRFELRNPAFGEVKLRVWQD